MSISIHPDIGIKICLKCPYDDCIGDICPLILAEVKRVRKERKKEKNQVKLYVNGKRPYSKRKKYEPYPKEKLVKMAEVISRDGPLLTSEVVRRFDIRHNLLNSFGKRGIIKLVAIKPTGKNRIVVKEVYPHEYTER